MSPWASCLSLHGADGLSTPCSRRPLWHMVQKAAPSHSRCPVSVRQGLVTQQLHHSQDQPQDVITWLCCSWQSRGRLLRLALGSLPRQGGGVQRAQAALLFPRGSTSTFAQGVHVSVRTKSDKHPVFLTGLDAGGAPLTPGYGACRAGALLTTWMLSPACHFRQFSNTCPASC